MIKKDLLKENSLLKRRIEKLEKRLEILEGDSVTDSLTRLLNRKSIMNTIKQEIIRLMRYSKRFSLMIIDIDNFKLINDRYGHLAGDLVLKEISSVMKGGIRLSDRIGRIGGEEFIVLLPEASSEKALIVAEHLREAVEKHRFVIGKRRKKITISIGFGKYKKGLDLGKNLRRLDRALYKSKEGGRNRVTVAK